MANLIEYIQSQVYENSTEDISGSIMQQVLTRMASDEGVVNVHTISGQTPFADYNNAQAARDAVPAGFKKLGLVITYKLSSGWYVDEFIGSATSGWSTASNWKCLGPISVSQNASTGKTTITIGSQSYDVATEPVSVSQNTITKSNDLNVGLDTYNFTDAIIINLSPNNEKYADRNTARMTVPQARRRYNTILTYGLSDGTFVVEQATDSYWQENDIWRDLYNMFGFILNYTTDASTTRKQVKPTYRKRGLIITYYDGTRLINEQYTGTSFSDSNWGNDANWEELASFKDIMPNSLYLNIDMLYPLPSGYYTLNTAIANLQSAKLGTIIVFRSDLREFSYYKYQGVSSYNTENAVQDPVNWVPIKVSEDESDVLLSFEQECSTSSNSIMTLPKGVFKKGYYRARITKKTANLSLFDFQFFVDGNWVSVNISSFGEYHTFFLKGESTNSLARALAANVTTAGNVVIEIERVGDFEAEYSNKKFSLLNRYKALKPVKDNEYFSVRPQANLVAFKSFTPVIDYKGLLRFEGYTDYDAKDQTKPLLFEEHILTINQNENGNTTSFISYDGKNYTKYVSPDTYKASALNCSFLFGIGSSSDGLVVSSMIGEASVGALNLLYWSLDGGRTFEPCLDTLRAKISIGASELFNGIGITIGEHSYSCVDVATIQTYLSALTGGSAARIAAARAYLADKVLITANTQDKLRTLAGLLINDGYKVRLTSDTLYVYWSDFGTSGNGEEMIVGSTTKTFSDGVDWDIDDIKDSTRIDVDSRDTGLTYSNGNKIYASDADEFTSILNIDGKWHFFGYYIDGGGYVSGQLAANVDYVVDDITDLVNTTFHYYKVCDSPAVSTGGSLLEPIASYNVNENIIFVGFRPQDYDVELKYAYSLDKGETWSALQKLPTNVKCSQANVALFITRNPFIDYQNYDSFYNNTKPNAMRMVVAVVSNRQDSVFYVATASFGNGFENLIWSDFVALNRFSPDGYLENGQVQNIEQGIYYASTSIGAMCYADLHKGLLLMYVGRKSMDVGSSPVISWVPMITLEEC